MYCDQDMYEIPADSQVLVDKTVIGEYSNLDGGRSSLILTFTNLVILHLNVNRDFDEGLDVREVMCMILNILLIDIQYCRYIVLFTFKSSENASLFATG